MKIVIVWGKSATTKKQKKERIINWTLWESTSKSINGQKKDSVKLATSIYDNKFTQLHKTLMGWYCHSTL